MQVVTCSRCPAFVWAADSAASGLCAGCRSGPPTQLISTPPSPPEVERPWWQQTLDAEGGCPL